MSDSRRAAMRVLGKVFFPFLTRLSQFSLVFAVCFFLTWILSPQDFTPEMRYTLFLLFFSVGLWFTEAIPPFATGLLILVYLVYVMGSPYFVAEPKDVAIYVNTWSSPVIWLMLGGFFMAEGMRKSGLDQSMLRAVTARLGEKPGTVLFGLMMLTAVASMVMSNTATTAMILAAVLPLCIQMGRDKPFAKALILGIPAAASLGGMGTIIGSAPNAVAVGALNTKGLDVSFGQWMLLGIPPALASVILIWFVLMRTYGKDAPPVKLHIEREVPDRPTRENRAIVTGTVFLTILMWMTSPLHGIHVAAVAAIPIVFLTVSGVVNGDDVRTLPWDTLMLVAGGLALGLSLQQTGLATYFVEKLGHLNIPAAFMLIIFSFITVLLSNVMSNTAASTILIPIAMLLTPNAPVLAAVAIGLAASTALFLPVSTPPNAMAYATGFLDQKDFRLTGLVAGLVVPIMLLLWLAVML